MFRCYCVGNTDNKNRIQCSIPRQYFGEEYANAKCKEFDFDFATTTSVPQQLNHITVNRPRKPRAQKPRPSRPNRQIDPPQDRLKIDEGFDEFFKASPSTTNETTEKPVSNSSNKESKQKKDKRSLSNLFSRFNHRTSKSEEQLKDVSPSKKHSNVTALSFKKLRANSKSKSPAVDEADVTTSSEGPVGSEVKVEDASNQTNDDLETQGLATTKPRGQSVEESAESTPSPSTTGVYESPGMARRSPFLGVSAVKGANLMAELRQRAQISDNNGHADGATEKQSNTNLRVKPAVQPKPHSPKIEKARLSSSTASSEGDVNMTLSPSTDSGIGVSADVDTALSPKT